MYYILQGDEPKLAELKEWALWFSCEQNRIIRQDDLDGIRVSTVFLGIDYNFLYGGRPILFETMVFGGDLDEEQVRYCTKDDALMGHLNILKRVIKGHKCGRVIKVKFNKDRRSIT